ncbi:hypothetical protein CLNEO_18430 [Anaerotignum neopropionicum]|uniref:Uncharacterized protein n=1 Tax=Anaerotignum neopropionicum TaxID=36847 RepID=A0A136WE83_9FIRM|nr:hypothetical protein [Anaerotignum neopropionicum]KXL52820.1 hypothetical protein CLNEO_18430 [Anaerotignum neopropionicum]
MNMGFGIYFTNQAELNLKHVTAIKVLCGRTNKILYMDERTKHFEDVKPFAYDSGFYYVVCPCCHQIERVSKHYFQDGNKAKIHCSTRTITQKTKFKKGSESIEQNTSKSMSFNLDLDDWKA